MTENEILEEYLPKIAETLERIEILLYDIKENTDLIANK